jgi:hypothetical protein
MRKIYYKFFLILLFFTAIILQTNLYSQVTQEWVVRYPGPTNDLYGPFLAVDKQGNSYIAGTHVINDTINILCAKYNTQGVQQWAALYKPDVYTRPTGLSLDSSGNAYVISNAGPSYLLPLNGIIVKFNSLNGSMGWAKKYIGQYGESSFLDIKIDRLNNIYVAGWTDTSHLVIRYNTNGDSVWVRKYHPQPYGLFDYIREVANACTLDDSLNIIFTGQRISHYMNPSFDYDSLLTVKYSSTGILRWERVYGYSYFNNWGTKITTDQNGNIYIGGGTAISGNGVYLTLKYDRNGVQQWAKIYDAPGSGDNNLRGIAMDRINNALYVTGGAIVNGTGVAATINYNPLTGDTIWVKTDTGIYNGGRARDINLDSSGNIYITGETYNFPSYVPYDIFTERYSMAGNQVWRIIYNGSFNGLDIGRALGLDALNNVYVLGTSPSSSQVTDYVVIKYVQFVGVKPISENLPMKYELFQNYPNPFNPATKIKFSIPKRNYIQLKIYDVLGRIRETLVDKELNAAEYEVTFNASGYSSGVYFYKIEVRQGGSSTVSFTDTKKMVLIK